MTLLRVGKFGHKRLSYHGPVTFKGNGDTYPGELVVWPFRVKYGGTGVFAGIMLQVRERGVDPPLWRTLWKNMKKTEVV